jgi:hypothetical protein
MVKKKNENSPVSDSWVCYIWTYHLFDFIALCHFHSIFLGANYKLKAPESIFGQSEPATNGGTTRIAKESKVFRKE